MLKKSLFVAFLVLLVFGATGCIKINKQKAATSNLGGVFVSSDRMETWQHKSLLMTPGSTAGSIAETDVYFLMFDPSDNDAIYLGTRANGLYYSYNGGEGWNESGKLPAGFIRDLAIDTKNKCTLYGGVENKIYKSDDCARTWKSVWYADSDTKKVTAVALDWYDPSVIYAGLSDGSLLKSEDFGVSWKLSNKFSARVNKIVVDPNDSRVIYAGIVERGMYKSKDKGGAWENLNLAMKDFKDSNIYSDFVLSKSNKDTILYANKYGLLRSLDAGVTWSAVKLLTQPGAETIYSVAIDPNNAGYIYYSTDKALYKTIDAGVNWVVKKMPTTRIAGELLVHPKDGSKVFMGVKSVEQ